jgi:resuscitation-promoting factor RpfA
MKVRTQIHAGAACYVVQSGDTLSGIAAQFGSSVQAIYQSNLTTIGSDPNLIVPGQKLYIPG